MTISSAVDASAVARVVGIETSYKDLRGGGVLYLPQRVAVVGQGSTASTFATTKRQVTSAFEVGALYGFGSPLHLAARQLFPENGDGVGTIPVTVYPLDDAGTGVAATGDITPGGTPTVAASYVVKINNIRSEAFVISVGDTVAEIVTAMTAAINAVLEMPVTAVDNTTDVQLTSKWKGVSANDIHVEVDGSTAAGNSFAITQPAGGLVNPVIDDALAQIGNVWETMVVNCLDIADTTALDAYSTLGEGRWGSLVRKPLVVVTGNSNATVALATAVPDARKTDRTNCAIPNPGGNDLPLVIAARAVARMAVLANNNPPFDYGSQKLTGLTPGTDGQQWTYTQRDAAVKAGSSTVEVKDGVVNMSDTITFYHPTGDPVPAYRFVVDIVKLQNVIFNLDLEFVSDEWDGAPLIPDDQPTVNRSAKKPKTAVAAAAAIVNSLGLEAILSDTAATIPDIRAAINSQNPKRLDMIVPIKLSGNSNIISIDLEFGFNFGAQTVVA